MRYADKVKIYPIYLLLTLSIQEYSCAGIISLNYLLDDLLSHSIAHIFRAIGPREREIKIFSYSLLKIAHFK